MIKQIALFALRWALNGFGLWVAVRLLGTGYSDQTIQAGFWGFVGASLLISLLNVVLKPLLVVVSFPAIVLSFGLFTLILNGIIVYYGLVLAPGFSMSFGNSIITGFLLSLINYIVGMAMDNRRYTRRTS